MPPIFNFDTNTTLLDAVRLILIIATPLAFLTSIVLLSLYRRAVLRQMQSRSNSGIQEPAPTGSASRSDEPVQPPLRIHVADAASPDTERFTSNELYLSLLHGPRRAAMIYTVAGLGYALVTTWLFLRATKSEFQLLKFLVVFWHYAWPVAITLSLLAASGWWAKVKVFSAYFLTIVLLGLVSIIGNSASNWLQIVALWFTTNFPAALLLLAFLNRRVRAVGPLVLTFMVLTATGLVLLPTFAINIGEIWEPLMSIRAALGLNISDTFNLIFFVGILGFCLLGWLAMRMIGTWYHHKKVSEQSITMDAIWLLFAVFQAVGLIFEGEHWFTVSLMAFAVYKGIAWAGFWLADRYAPLSQMHPDLLVLRVFSLGRQSEQLFEELSRHWRSVGSMQLIAGPDLASSTIEPHEFLDFLSGKLARQFIDSPQTLDVRISQMDRRPDFDGQFRVNDFFCYDDTWKRVLSRLVAESDAVIMDLRGFSSQNSGCIFEIDELVNLMPLGRVVFIIDDSTDEPFLQQVLQKSWKGMSTTSPNRVATSGMPGLLRLNQVENVQLRNLLQVLANAVKSQPKTRVLAPASVSGLKSS
ncbi:MAG: hypothetical protein M3Y68_13175 [Chloroflexota bacterium]|nr:hypothetical protein [Chloroflexota bacterium]